MQASSIKWRLDDKHRIDLSKIIIDDHDAWNSPLDPILGEKVYAPLNNVDPQWIYKKTNGDLFGI